MAACRTELDKIGMDTTLAGGTQQPPRHCPGTPTGEPPVTPGIPGVADTARHRPVELRPEAAR